MASSITSLELHDLECYLRVSDGADGVLVDSVGDDFFASRNLALEPESVQCSSHGNDSGEYCQIQLTVTITTQRLEVFKIYPKADFNDARYPVTNQVRRAGVFSDRGEKKERSTSQL
jgi:hypothetical protein